jgi:lipoic acid synthetase
MNDPIQTSRPILIDPRRGDVEDDASSPEKRSMLAIAGSLLAEISLPKLAVAWILMIGVPGLMLGLGESQGEVIAALRDLRAVDCQRLTLGQYLRPSLAHLPVARYWSPEEFADLGAQARAMGFAEVRSGPLVRSSYHAASAG